MELFGPNRRGRRRHPAAGRSKFASQEFKCIDTGRPARGRPAGGRAGHWQSARPETAAIFESILWLLPAVAFSSSLRFQY